MREIYMHVDFNQGVSYKNETLVKNDYNSIRFIFKTKQDVTDKQIFVTFKNSDDTTYIEECTIESINEVSIEVPTSALSVIGTVNCQIAMYDNSGYRLTSPSNFDYLVTSDLSDEAIVATDDIPILTQLITDVGTLETSVGAAEGLRVIAETNRDDAEIIRLASEITRISSEDDRNSAEIIRLASEITRISSETDRNNAEITRLSSEITRVNAESDRVIAETNRDDAEIIRLSSEIERNDAEVIRLASEITRVSSETDRDNAEVIRLASEITRVSSENDRKDAEIIRLSSEITRVNAESDRVIAETGRDDAEDLRIILYNLVEQKLADGEFIGEQGIQGIQGIQGEIGLTGDTGIQGIQGEIGLTGDTGNGISSVIRTSGDGSAGTTDTYTITYTDTTTSEFDVYNGADGEGDMIISTYDPDNINSDVFDMVNMKETTTAKVLTAQERLEIAKVVDKVDNSQVLTDVPAGALFTDTDTIYTHPANHAISVTTGLQTALDNKVSKSGDTITGDLKVDGHISLTENINTSSIGETTIDWGLSNKQSITLTEATNITFTNPSSPCNLLIKITQDVTGGRVATWASNVKWANGGIVPILSTAPNSVDIISLYFDGTDYYGQFGLNFV